jgi:BirA family biotin operon repressor/biotin-[acetyl-CoA-carboxylase] ligase
LKSNLPESLVAAAKVPDEIDAQLKRVAGRLGSLGRPLHWFDATTSTNTVAARRADLGATEGTTVIADTQTGGRGRHQRSWFSPPGAGLYVSVILRGSAVSTGDPGSPSLLTLASGVALAEAILASSGLRPDLKWPNDLMSRGRKLGGILAEGAHDHHGSHVVLGFGINVRVVAYPRELSDRVTSIEAETGSSVERAFLLAESLAAIAHWLGELRAKRFNAILTAWRGFAASLRSAPVEWDSPHGVRRGHAEDVDEHGALLIRIAGRLERVIAGEVRWL